MAGRKKIVLTEEQLIDAVVKVRERGDFTQKAVAEELKVSYPTFLNAKQELGLDPKHMEISDRILSFEKKDYSEDEFMAEMATIDEGTEKTVGYNYFKISFPESIILINLGDLHIGAETTVHTKIAEIVKFIHDHANVKVILSGDYIDNFGKFAVGGGLHQQTISITKQKELAEWICTYLGDKILGVIQGCHEEFSYRADGFDFGKYLANKADARYLGKRAVLDLEVGENTYKVYVDHNSRNYSNDNLCHGLKVMCRKYVDFDLGFGAHRHVANAENSLIRGKMVKTCKCSPYKKPDRFIEKIKTPECPILSQCYVMLAEKIEPYWLGIVYFEDVRHAVRFL